MSPLGVTPISDGAGRSVAPIDHEVVGAYGRQRQRECPAVGRITTRGVPRRHEHVRGRPYRGGSFRYRARALIIYRRHPELVVSVVVQAGHDEGGVWASCGTDRRPVTTAIVGLLHLVAGDRRTTIGIRRGPIDGRRTIPGHPIYIRRRPWRTEDRFSGEPDDLR